MFIQRTVVGEHLALVFRPMMWYTELITTRAGSTMGAMSIPGSGSVTESDLPTISCLVLSPEAQKSGLVESGEAGHPSMDAADSEHVRLVLRKSVKPAPSEMTHTIQCC